MKKRRKYLETWISDIFPFFGVSHLPSMQGIILFSPDSPADFEKKLVAYKKNLKEFLEKPIEEKLEKWEAYLSIIKKVDALFQDELRNLKKGSQVAVIEKKYAQFLGPMLTELVNEVGALSRNKSTPDKSRDFEKLFLFGKELGESFSQVMMDIKKIKFLTNSRKKVIFDKFQKIWNALKKTAEQQRDLIQNQLKQIST
jgi:hypothetical protein